MIYNDLLLIIAMFGSIFTNVVSSLDAVTFITTPHITYLDLECGMTIFAELWYFVMDLKDGA